MAISKIIDKLAQIPARCTQSDSLALSSSDEGELPTHHQKEPTLLKKMPVEIPALKLGSIQPGTQPKRFQSARSLEQLSIEEADEEEPLQ